MLSKSAMAKAAKDQDDSAFAALSERFGQIRARGSHSSERLKFNSGSQHQTNAPDKLDRTHQHQKPAVSFSKHDRAMSHSPANRNVPQSLWKLKSYEDQKGKLDLRESRHFLLLDNSACFKAAKATFIGALVSVALICLSNMYRVFLAPELFESK
jgi:hypothetical protein